MTITSPLPFDLSRPETVARWASAQDDLRAIETAYRKLDDGHTRSLEGPDVDDDGASGRVVASRTLLRHTPRLDRALVQTVADRDLGRAHRFLENERLTEADHELLLGVVLDRIAACLPEDWNLAPYGGPVEAEFTFLAEARERLARLPDVVLDRAEALLTEPAPDDDTGGLQAALSRDRRAAGLWRSVLGEHPLQKERLTRLVRWAADRNRPFLQAAFLAHPDHPVRRTLSGLRAGTVGVATVAHGLDRWLEQRRYSENRDVRVAVLDRLEAGLEEAGVPERLVRAALLHLLGHVKARAELVRVLVLLARVDGDRAATAVEQEVRSAVGRLTAEDIARILSSMGDGEARGRLIAALGQLPGDPSAVGVG